MERSTPEAEAPGIRNEASDVVGGEEVAAEEQEVPENVSQYVQQNPDSPNTRLFSFLALLKSYVPESYLLMSECQQILGPPDPIHGGPPFEERMKPFTDLISTSNPRPDHVCMIKTKCAQRAVELLADLGIFRSTTMKNFMISLCGDQVRQDVIQFIKDLLTKREMGENGQSKFSRLIEDIMEHENFHNAVSVLKTASDKFRHNATFPQTISRLYYITEDHIDYEAAEEWAEKAIERAPSNSFVADTLGQVYKNRLKAQQEGDILNMAEEAFSAFRNEEEKAENEEDPELQGTAGTDSFSVFFNNRGLFGFIQVAKIAFKKKLKAEQRRSLIRKYQIEVEHKFDFFEWYLTYSKPDMATSEPHYFWKDVTRCYNYYTERTAAESTSFPGLLDCLNHGLFTSKGRNPGLKEDEKTVSDLEEIRNVLKTTYEENADDVNMAERYILSNIILSNKMPDSPQLTPVEDLQAIIRRFLGTEERRRGPEFCLLVLLLFWPEEQVVQEENDEEVEQKATEDDGSEDKTWEDEDSNEEQETRGDTAQLHHGHMFDPDLQQYVTFMEKAFDRAKYAKYLRGRYLLPLFFLGKGSGLSKWIHKSRLDAIVERNVDAALADERHRSKECQINDMWISGEVWQLPEIQDMLLPVSLMPQEHEEQEVIVRVGEKRIKASVEQESPLRSPKLFYLGFTIQGPVVFSVGVSHMSGQ